MGIVDSLVTLLWTLLLRLLHFTVLYYPVTDVYCSNLGYSYFWGVKSNFPKQ
jgi:hypothetical protein